MMKNKTIPKDAKVGDKFLGCPVCSFQLDIGTIAKNVCPYCGANLSVYTVEEKDLKNEN